VTIEPDFEIRPYYAGHVLGAAMFYIRVGQQSLLYTGDYNMTPDRHLGSGTCALQCVAVCCIVLQCVVVCCSVLQHVSLGLRCMCVCGLVRACVRVHVRVLHTNVLCHTYG